MTIDPQLIKDIKGSEGCSLKAYKDTLGYWTIGYGHLLIPITNDWTSYVVTQAQAEIWLYEDINKAYDACLLLIEWPYLNTPCRQNAVVELVFNMGSKWRGFAKTRFDLQQQDWKSAHDQLLDSLWAKEVGPTRSTRLAKYLLTGEYPS